MSGDSDEDWFEKDLDKFVVNVQNKTSTLSINTGGNKGAAKDGGGPSHIYFDSEYGGNYNKIESKSNTNNNNNNNNNANDDNQQQQQHVQPIAFKKLHFVSELTPLNTFIEIMQPDSGFEKTLNRSNNSNKMLDLLLKTIVIILSMPFYEYKKSFLKLIIDAKAFWLHIEMYLKNTKIINVKPSKKITQKNVIEIDERQFWENLITICKCVSLYFPLANKEFLETCLEICKQHQQQHPEPINKISFVKLISEFEVLLMDISSNDQKTDAMEIYPTLNELKQNEPVQLKPNIIKGRYTNVKHYLDLHLSLLREDCIAPLRDGIDQFISECRQSKGSLKMMENNFLTIYPKVRILRKQHKLLIPRNNKCEYLMVDVGPDERQKMTTNDNTTIFNFSKKFMFGSLLLFTTSSEVDDLILAVIANREIELLVKGYIQIEIIKTYNCSSIFDHDFIMFESDVYFEPYHHVHRVLKNLNEDQFPMRNFIIDADQTNNYPDYLQSLNKISYVHKKCTLNLKNFTSWPDATALKLDASQANAFKHGLTHKFSLIQGPPGTGKTFVGLELLSAIVKNTDKQILIICLTNHALDQFLTGALACTNDIVRMGNQSKSDLLDPYNVKQLSVNLVTDKRLKNCFYQLKCQYNDLMQKFEEFQLKINNNNDGDEKTDNELIEKNMLDYQNAFRLITRKQEEMKQIAEYNILKSKRLIGMTSTFAARSNTLIKLLKTPIVFIEEAAELLESHIVAALTSDTQHLILIGDHQQLRPTTSVHKLSTKYNMDISLFERMINNNVNCITLNTQHRMRPEIANLIRPSIYKELFDNKNVQEYGNMNGIEKNLFFINHTEMESAEKNDETTKKNVFEAQYMVALCNYLILQGYAPEDITILTTYNGQLLQFSQERKKYQNLRKVRITVVDNYQGEENRIILLSLVRSNRADKIGYLAIKNRICVALSRAREALYIIGNMDLLSKNSSIWNDIRNELTKQNAIDNRLPLVCQTHKNTTKIRDPNDFKLLKYGGCIDDCNVILNCGHHCYISCHTNMFEHISDCNCYNNNNKNKNMNTNLFK